MRGSTLFTVAAIAGLLCVSSLGEATECGGFAGIKCEEGLWCDPEAGQCGVADVAGSCVVVPEICTKEFMPVCGCDNRTYGNDCERRAAKIAKKSEGECTAAEKSNGGTICPAVIDKVCATKDGKRKTYNNQCEANRDGATNITKDACEGGE